MIKFSLKCAQGHQFDSWFQSADAYDTLAARKMVACAICGATDVEKSVMAPSVRAGRGEAADPDQRHSLSAPATPAEQAMAELRRKVEAHSDYVGTDFVNQARQMHEGETPSRPIHGEAKLTEARKLIEDGVPVLPLPFRTSRKVN
ncbi:DUF1178 family protein [Roseovarius sp. D0-M9]|uniref:DUF1178 family protein n=1 Tax=Roseovarius sp. D0-M9 TaxID=3127117 RepID=UPI00300FF8CB